MNICMLTSSFPRYRGDGAGVFVYELADHLTRKGCAVSVLAPHAAGSNATEIWADGGLTVRRYRYFYPQERQKLCYGSGMVKNIRQHPATLVQAPFFLAAQAAALNRLIKNKSIDLVHAHWSIPQGVVAWMNQHFCGLPYIVSLHGTDVHGLRYPLLTQLNRIVCQGAAACTVNSAETGRVARRLLGAHNFQTVPMGVNVRLFQPADRKRDQSPKADDGPCILFVGRLIDLKGVDYLIKALARLLPVFPKIRLQIVGQGPEQPKLVRLASELGIREQVSFTGNVAHADLPDIYRKADVFVLPSCVSAAGETEGLGVVLLEAMASGVPVIGSRIGGIPQIIADGVTGLLAEPRDSDAIARQILKILTKPGLRDRLTANAHDLIADSFSWEVVSQRFAAIYDAVVQRRNAV